VRQSPLQNFIPSCGWLLRAPDKFLDPEFHDITILTAISCAGQEIGQDTELFLKRLQPDLIDPAEGC
jgi:hypothetical protein